MIRGIILDVDGVIVGEKVGYNSPLPNPDVIARLKQIEEAGVKISLCTAKPHYAIRQIIDEARLSNLHITDGGAVIIDPIDNVVMESHLIDKSISKRIIKSCIDADVYVEVYSLSEYLIAKSQQSKLTITHQHILQRAPRVVESLVDEIEQLSEIVKIMPIANDENDKARLKEMFKSFELELTLSWGVHPIALPHQFGIITTKGISKAQALLHIAESSCINTNQLLGIGDSTSDWQFIEKCGYAATLENGSPELKDLIASKNMQSHVGGSVDENGILDIFDHFKL